MPRLPYSSSAAPPPRCFVNLSDLTALQALLAPDEETGPGSMAAAYRVHRKNGRIFALLPADPRSQSGLADLLPAQSLVARIYRQAVLWTGRCGLGFPRSTVSLAFAAKAPLVRMIRDTGGSLHPPVLLPGNPSARAPRLIIICRDDRGHPRAVIKAGATPASRDLVRKEHHFLTTASRPGGSGLPQVLDFLDDPDATAFAMEFVDGDSPGWPPPPGALEGILSGWLDRDRTLKIGQCGPWRTLVSALTPAGRAMPGGLAELAETRIHPCRFHGDFAPWNVRAASNGDWRAIDWERGESDGVPGWDWLHYGLQPAILVKRWPAERVMAHAEQIIAGASFLRYLAGAGGGGRPEGFARGLLRAYLLYNWHVLQPTEQTAVQEQLAMAAAGR